MQKISANAIILLKDTLSTVFWYKKNLVEYLRLSVSDGEIILSKINWIDIHKRETVSTFIDYLVKNNCNDDLIYLISELACKNDFNDLKKATDPELAIKIAQENINKLKEIYKLHHNVTIEKKKKEESKQKYLDEIQSKQYFNNKLEELKQIFFSSYSLSPIHRGYKFEEILRDLNELFDLDPRASYRITGEQIDGAFSLDNTEYIIEAKWHTPSIDHTHVIIFLEKVKTKLENTLGLFISHSSFTETAIIKANQKNIILMDGEDLVYVLENKINYIELLRKKKRHASQTGNCFYKAKDIIEKSL
ncbi:MAG: restriction endonuclease [Sulfurimonas sp.]|nr:restriction endonuclease [Sulfurimonas sp.]